MFESMFEVFEAVFASMVCSQGIGHSALGTRFSARIQVGRYDERVNALIYRPRHPDRSQRDVLV
jgi:hypothetical protein